MRHTGLIVTVGLLIILIQGSVLISEASVREKESESFQQEIFYLERQVDTLNNKLDGAKQIADVRTDQAAELMAEMQQVQSECTDISEDVFRKVQSFEQELAAKIDWLALNSDLGNVPADDQGVKQAIQSCMTTTQDACVINTGCLYAVNKYKVGLKYLNDIYTSGNDKLLGIDEILEKGGGDCEDWSLFAAAQIRELSRQCGQQKVTIEAISVNPDATNYVLSAQDNWVIEKGVEGVNIGDYQEVAVVCGHMLIQNSNSIGGHCVIGFFDKPLQVKTIVSDLQGGILVEPQSGSIVDTIGQTITVYDKQEQLPLTSVWLVFSENDLIANFGNGWQSYQSISEELTNLVAQVPE